MSNDLPGFNDELEFRILLFGRQTPFFGGRNSRQLIKGDVNFDTIEFTVILLFFYRKAATTDFELFHIPNVFKSLLKSDKEFLSLSKALFLQDHDFQNPPLSRQ
ncbi:MAG: hypothetical protein BWX60_01079 [Candidatus Marinimicrobia bacterium ADurb.Bin030]|nr:MAG: hypothetical protein BWX60_01079 [Candidatus Marinimicrobia bacterium ADurb.Bin030]